MHALRGIDWIPTFCRRNSRGDLEEFEALERSPEATSLGGPQLLHQQSNLELHHKVCRPICLLNSILILIVVLHPKSSDSATLRMFIITNTSPRLIGTLFELNAHLSSQNWTRRPTRVISMTSVTRQTWRSTRKCMTSRQL
jgi:hypothetical protein